MRRGRGRGSSGLERFALMQWSFAFVLDISGFRDLGAALGRIKVVRLLWHFTSDACALFSLL